MPTRDHIWKIAIEFRNQSWYHEEVYDLLDQYKVSMVIHDLPAVATPLTESTASFRYLRFHGPEVTVELRDDFLYQYAQYVKTGQVRKDGLFLF
ncbi:MAG: DUF72 domain-containing protein [Segetibacter sp.]